MVHNFDQSSLPSCSKQQNSSKAFDLAKYLSYPRFSSTHKAFSIAISTHSKPKTYKQAAKDTKWQEATNAKILTLENNKTWTVTDLSLGKTIIGCKWVYRVEYKADGSVEEYKARLVAKGFTQKNGIDYAKTFSLVAKMTTIYYFLVLVASQKLIFRTT